MKLLSNGSVDVLDRDSLNDIEELLLHSVKKEDTEYLFNLENNDLIECKTDNGKLSFTVSKNKIELKNGVIKLLSCIKNKGCDEKANGGSFDLPFAEELANSLYISTKKADSTHKDDLTIKFQLTSTGSASKEHNVSIKSWVGSKPTLFNSSILSSRMTFEIIGSVDFDELKKISSKENTDARKAILAGDRIGFTFLFSKYADDIFRDNLAQIDCESFIPYIALAHFQTQGASTSLVLKNALKDRFPSFEHKWKTFLQRCALGMTAGKPYKEEDNISDNLLVIDGKGELCCYIGRNRLENLLCDNAMIDTPSQSRHQYGFFYQKDEKIYIDLNFQVKLNLTKKTTKK